MPANIVKNPKDERAWDKAKKIVKKQKNTKGLKDKDWALVTHVFKNVEKSKDKSKKKGSMETIVARLEKLAEFGDHPLNQDFSKSDKGFTMSKTYQVVTPESATKGDFADHGFEYKDHKFDSLLEMAEEIHNEGATEPSDSSGNPHTWYSSTDPEMDHHTGEETTYAFHPEGLSDIEARELYKMVTNESYFKQKKQSAY